MPVTSSGERHWPDNVTRLPAHNAALAAWGDLRDGVSQSWMWSSLAIQDIKLRYRGSVLGPFWLTLSSIIMVAAMGVIYARLFNMQAASYLPYLALGIIIWQFVSSLFSDGCQSFLAAEGIIQQVPVPFSIHAYRVVFRNLIIFAHNAIIIPIGFVLFQLPVSWRIFEVIPGLVLVVINGVWVAILLGMISARFRDIPPIVGNILQVMFFVTPIIWPIDALGNLRWVAELNPAFAAIDVIRAPLLGVPTAPLSWPLIIGTTVVGSALTFAFFTRFRTRIVYWI